MNRQYNKYGALEIALTPKEKSMLNGTLEQKIQVLLEFMKTFTEAVMSDERSI